MNKNILEGKWNQLKGNIQKEWGELTDDEIHQIDGDTTKLIGLLQERYGKSQEEAEQAIQEWERRYAA